MNHYFQNHHYKPEKHTPSQQQQEQPNSHCATERPLGKEPISRNDIDMLQLMNPNMTPEEYLLQITELYHKEQNLKTREDNNKPMQLALSTCKIIDKQPISSGDTGEGPGEDQEEDNEEDNEGQSSPQHHSSDKNDQ